MLFDMGEIFLLATSAEVFLRLFNFSDSATDFEVLTKALKSFLSSSISFTFRSRFLVKRLSMLVAVSFGTIFSFILLEVGTASSSISSPTVLKFIFK